MERPHGRTRIKICGLTRAEDVRACANLAVDAVGFVFYPPSPRFLAPEQAASLVSACAPFLTRVGLFVNAEPAWVRAVLDQVPLHVLQFHGDGATETADYCRSFGRPYIKAARMRPGVDLLEFAACYPDADAILCDAFVDGYGGHGQGFDWGLLPAPEQLGLPLVLSGGLEPETVGDAIRQVRPAAVDVSSGVEASKGIKEFRRMASFVEEVRKADESLRSA